MRERIVFFGNERLATGITTEAPALQALVGAGYEVAAVISNHQPARSRKTRPLEVEEIATQHHIPLLLPSRVADIQDQLGSYDAKIGILIAYGKIVPQQIIDLFPYGIINLHPSLLPLHRGPTPIEQVILNGATETGVSVMQLTSKMDAGPVFSQQRHRLTRHETKQELADRLLNLGKDLLLEQLPLILTGRAAPQAQDDTSATYDHLINKTDGLVDWTKPAEQLEREVRAYLGWPGSRTTLLNREVTVTAAHVSAAKTEGLAIETGSGYLVIDRLKPAGKREMTAQEFLAGNQSSRPNQSAG